VTGTPHTLFAFTLCLLVLIGIAPIRSVASDQADAFHVSAIQIEALEAVRYYLDLNCGVTSPQKNWPPRPLERLQRLSTETSEVETQLIKVLRTGPEGEELQRMSRALEEQWSDLNSFLVNPETDVQLDTSPILKSLMNKRETYVQEGLSRITKQYQVRSAIALDEFAAHGSARAQHALEEVRSIGSAASKSAVRQALESKSLRSRQKQ
jgi:hypothetical protein